MASAHGLITVAELEYHMGGLDLENKDARYTDTVVESGFITTAEQMVIGITGTTWTSSTITEGVQAVVKLFAAQITYNDMIVKGHYKREDAPIIDLKFIKTIIEMLIEPAQDLYKQAQGFYAIKQAQNNG